MSMSQCDLISGSCITVGLLLRFSSCSSFFYV